MSTKYKGSRSRLRGATQLELFARETLAACAGPPVPPRTNQSGVILQEVGEDEPPDGDRPQRGPGFQLVALWHDRSWQPLRVFRRADGASVVVFETAEAART
ncbi:MAG TPA: hypothetical protein VK669_11685 [Candidatus Limnocylindrales bacterium]|nr:hypothetical protein [Candidatus Limnocylindrales bacterium]